MRSEFFDAQRLFDVPRVVRRELPPMFMRDAARQLASRELTRV